MLRNGFFNHKAATPISLEKFRTVNAVQPSENVSSKYSFIPTTKPLEVLADYGWFPVAVTEARTRMESKDGFQKHVVRLANSNFNTLAEIGGTIPQVLLTNDHSGAGAFELLVGLFEKICANGLCVPRGELGGSRILHRGYTTEAVEGGIRGIMDNMNQVITRVDEFKNITLQRDQQLALAEAAIELRWDGEAFAVKPEDVLTVRHRGQEAPTLWNTYNRVQETIIRGGARQVNTEGRRSRSRAVTSVKEDLRLNKALWTLTEKMAELVK